MKKLLFVLFVLFFGLTDVVAQSKDVISTYLIIILEREKEVNSTFEELYREASEIERMPGNENFNFVRYSFIDEQILEMRTQCLISLLVAMRQGIDFSDELQYFERVSESILELKNTRVTFLKAQLEEYRRSSRFR